MGMKGSTSGNKSEGLFGLLDVSKGVFHVCFGTFPQLNFSFSEAILKLVEPSRTHQGFIPICLMSSQHHAAAAMWSMSGGSGRNLQVLDMWL